MTDGCLTLPTYLHTHPSSCLPNDTSVYSVIILSLFYRRPPSVKSCRCPSRILPAGRHSSLSLCNSGFCSERAVRDVCSALWARRGSTAARLFRRTGRKSADAAGRGRRSKTARGLNGFIKGRGGRVEDGGASGVPAGAPTLNEGDASVDQIGKIITRKQPFSRLRVFPGKPSV